MVYIPCYTEIGQYLEDRDYIDENNPSKLDEVNALEAVIINSALNQNRPKVVLKTYDTYYEALSKNRETGVPPFINSTWRIVYNESPVTLTMCTMLRDGGTIIANGILADGETMVKIEFPCTRKIYGFGHLAVISTHTFGDFESYQRTEINYKN